MNETEGKKTSVDEYLESRFNVLLKEYYDIMEDYEIRKGANVVFYDIPSEIDWYFKRGGSNGELLDKLSKKWVKLMTPFTPHIAEELSSRWQDGFVSEKELPEVDGDVISESAEAKEEYLKDVSDDIKQILEIADVEGEKIHLYIAESWKEEALKEIIENPDKGMGIMGELVQKIDAPSSKLSSFVQDVLQDIREKGQKKTWNISFDEYETLENNKEFLESQFETKIRIYKAGKEDIYDPVNKSKNAKPRKPAIYVE